MTSLILSERPGKLATGVVEVPIFMPGSISAARLDQMMPSWPENFQAWNAWWTPDEKDNHIREIIELVEPNVIVAFGRRVEHALLGGPYKPRPWLTKCGLVYSPDRMIGVLVFPHPSGRNRFWNNYANRADATLAIHEAAKGWKP